MAKYYTVPTAVGEAKIANAIALGSTITISELAIGDGGGTLPTPDSDRTALVNEVRRAPINTSVVDPDNPNWIVVEQILPPDIGGWTIREIGIYDTDGDLIAYGNYPETYKPVLSEGSGRTQTIRFVMPVSDTAAVTLKVDPSVVLATREYVDDGIAEHAASRNHPAATTTALGFVEKATVTEAKSGAADKFPDAAGMMAAMKQFGLGGNGVEATPNSQTDESLSGIYAKTNGMVADGVPYDGSWVWLLMQRGQRPVQIASEYSSNRWFVRAYQGSGTWAEWSELFSADSISTVIASSYGRRKYPDGHIEHWGISNKSVMETSGSVRVTFPIAFDNQCDHVMATQKMQTDNVFGVDGSPDRTGFSVRSSRQSGADDSAVPGFYWRAIGS